MKNYLYIIFVSSTLTLSAQQRYAISATVTDENTVVVPGAVAFLTNTKLATAVQNNGKFIISNLLPGTYELVVKMIGYVPYIKPVTIRDKTVNINIKLKESNTLLNTVTIKAKNANRDRYLKLFIKNFIGESTNARLCTIVNPEVINFHYDKETGRLSANADKFITIENKGLGYRLNYLLTQFDLDISSLSFFYKGYPYFEELNGNADQQKIWAGNRKTAYAGSVNHFFKTIANNTAATEGFYIFNIPEKVKGEKTPPTLPLNPDSVFKPINNNFRKLSEKYNKRSNEDTTSLYIVYRGGKMPYDFRASPLYDMKPPIKISSDNEQLSKIQPVTDDILLSENGMLFPPKSFLISGYWAWEKVAELMPTDYFTEFSKFVNPFHPIDSIAVDDNGDRMRPAILMLQNELRSKKKKP